MVVIIEEADDSFSDEEMSGPSSCQANGFKSSSQASSPRYADACGPTTESPRDTVKTREADTDAASEASADEWHDAVEIPDEEFDQRDHLREESHSEAEGAKAFSSSAVDDVHMVEKAAVLSGGEDDAGVTRHEHNESCSSEKDVEAAFAAMGLGEAAASRGEEKPGTAVGEEKGTLEVNAAESCAGREGEVEVGESTDATSSHDKDAKSEKEAMEEAEKVKAEGNKLYQAKDYGAALDLYYRALDLCPVSDETAQSRAVYHANAAICHLQLGDYEESALQSTKAVELNGSYMKAFMRRAQAHEALHHEEDALADYKKVIELEPANKQAHEAIRRLEPIVAEKREKLKEEMLGKLKDLGNTVLGHFGLSVDNFQAVKDPNTGSYSINFQK